MKFAIAIPSRFASKRFPAKALYPLLGVPMVIRVIRQCVRVLEPTIGDNDIYVVTEDAMVASCVMQYGYQAIMDETPASSGTEKVVQVMDQIDADRIINVQGDEPVVDPAAIANMIMASIMYPASVLQAYRMSSGLNNNSVKIVTDRNDRILYISRSPIPSGATEFKEHVGIFSYGKHHLETYGVQPRLPLEEAEDIELVRFLELGVKVRAICNPVSKVNRIPVDSPDDVPVVEEAIRQLGLT